MSPVSPEGKLMGQGKGLHRAKEQRKRSWLWQPELAETGGEIGLPVVQPPPWNLQSLEEISGCNDKAVRFSLSTPCPVMSLTCNVQFPAFFFSL